jgi:hypothetical protein
MMMNASRDLRRAPTVVAFAGRRIDAPEARPLRFALADVPLVTERVRDAFVRCAARALVCSAACGGDLIALEIAAERGLDAYIVLPFDAERFRATSVVDRPGDWGSRYDRAIERARKRGRLEIVSAARNHSDDEAYAAVSDRILGCALALGGGTAGVIAVAAWEGRPRGDGDLTWRLLREAQRAGVETESIQTSPQEEEG